MKRSFVILLASMLLVFSLTACGRNDNSNAHTSDDPPTTSQDADTNGQESQNSQNDALMGGGTGTPGDSMGDSMDDSSQSNQDSATNQDGSPAGNETAGSDVGVSYEQMLRNGRVHDTDGLLRDGENATSDTTRGIRDAAKDVARSAKNAVEDMTR